MKQGKKTPAARKNGKSPPLADFRPAAVNANRHTQRGLGMLDGSMSQDGFLSPITVAADGEAIDGSARLETAATRFDRPPIIVESDGTQPVIHIRRDIPNAQTPQAKRLAVAANRVGQVDLDFDPDVLATLAADVDLSQFWFPDELSELLGTAGPAGEDPGAQIDRAAELQEKWGTATGQLWTLGEHRLLCGDSTKPEDVARLMQGEKAGAVVTDPPYGMDLDVSRSDLGLGDPGRVSQRKRNYKPIENDDKPYDPSPLFSLWLSREMFLWGADYYSEKIPDRLKGSWIVWDKRDGIEGMEFSSSAFELCWSKQKHRRDIIRKRWTGVLGMESQDTEMRLHPTQKPIEVIEWILEWYTKAGDTVADPFGGSGTTMAACQKLGRKCRMIEISPAYCGVILERMSGLGLSPVVVK